MTEEKEILECFYFIKHNPPRDSGTWGGAIHKGACRVNGGDCKDVDGCFIKKLYQQLLAAKEENEKLRNLLGKPYKRRIDLENNKLTQQNKRMREVLEWIVLDIVKFKEIPFDKPMTGAEIQAMDKHNLILKHIAIQELAQQALNKGGE